MVCMPCAAQPHHTTSQPRSAQRSLAKTRVSACLPLLCLQVADVIGTFRMLSQLPSDSLGAYIISMAHTASDVLAVVLLQKECGGGWGDGAWVGGLVGGVWGMGGAAPA